MTNFSLRGIYDEVERRITPPVETVVHSEEFAATLKLVGMARDAVGSRIDAVGAAVLHAVNLPAGSDIRKLRRQVGDLDYELRRLRREVVDGAGESRPAGRPDETAGTSRTPETERGDDSGVDAFSALDRVKQEVERNTLRARNGIKMAAGLSAPRLGVTPRTWCGATAAPGCSATATTTSSTGRRC